MLSKKTLVKYGVSSSSYTYSSNWVFFLSFYSQLNTKKTRKKQVE